MKYEEYLDEFCNNKTFWKRTGEVRKSGLPLITRLQVWLLKRRGYLVRVEVEYHYDGVYNEKGAKKGTGYGFVRIYKYKFKTDVPVGPEIEKGSIGE